MDETYSLYEAKARLSAIVRAVREGGRAIITVHGEPAVEIRPIEPPPRDLASRLQWLTERGALRAAPNPSAPALKPIAKRPGSVRRFLDDRE